MYDLNKIMILIILMIVRVNFDIQLIRACKYIYCLDIVNHKYLLNTDENLFGNWLNIDQLWSYWV